MVSALCRRRQNEGDHDKSGQYRLMTEKEVESPFFIRWDAGFSPIELRGEGKKETLGDSGNYRESMGMQFSI